MRPLTLCAALTVPAVERKLPAMPNDVRAIVRALTAHGHALCFALFLFVPLSIFFDDALFENYLIE